MALNFDPGAYESAFQYGQNRNQQARNQYAQGMQSLGEAIPQYYQGMQQQAQLQRQNRMDQLATALKLKDQGIDPTSAMNYLSTGQVPQGQPDNSNQDNSSQPSIGPWSNPQPQGTPSATTGGSYASQPSPMMGSPIVAAHKNMMAGKQTGFGSMFQSQPLDQSRTNDPSYIASLPQNQRSALEWTQNQQRMNQDFSQRQAETQEMNKFRQSQANLQIGEKQGQFNEKQWADLVKNVNPETASSRTPVGIAARGNSNADRALATLSKPIVTNQEAGNVMADIASIYQNGSPSEFGMKHQEYSTLYGKLQGTIQQITGKPQDALPNDIKQRLTSVLTDLKNVNSTVINRNLDNIEKTRGKFIDSSGHRDDWNQLRSQYKPAAATTAAATPHPQDSEAVQWAKQNQNDPRAQKILQLNGAQ